jgi:hypothetical protein
VDVEDGDGEQKEEEEIQRGGVNVLNTPPASSTMLAAQYAAISSV